MRRLLLALALPVGVLAGSPGGLAQHAMGEEPPPLAAPEPELCREAIARHGSAPLDALASEEHQLWREAKAAEREARKLMKQTIGMGESSGALSRVSEVERLNRLYGQRVQTAFAICQCRQQRGDPNRDDCRWQYRKHMRTGR